MKKRYVIALSFLTVFWAWNSSLLAPAPKSEKVKLLSHRGVHQTFDREGLKNDTCTATRIFPPTHDLIENTPQSAAAAFAAGAHVVEIDIHPTTDGKFVVFHDWTVDCRTDGTGVTRQKSLTELKKLDIGFGYTADKGKTFPLRGKYVGGMPELSAFLAEFPEQQFLINFKSNNVEEGKAFSKLLVEFPHVQKQVFGVYGGSAPTNYVLEQTPTILGYTKPQTKQCLIQYMAYGWTGIVPQSCQNHFVAVPANFAWALWGWPNRFQQRMRNAGAQIILLGPMSLDDPGSTGIDTIEHTNLIPNRFDGYVWTNRIELIGPHLNLKS